MLRLMYIRRVVLAIAIAMLFGILHGGTLYGATVAPLQRDEAGSLEKELAKRRAESAKRIPARTRRVMQRATDELAESGSVEKSLQVGQEAPDFSLPNAQGEKVRFSELLERGPVVLTFYRGGWCPYCNLELRALQRALPRIRAAGATLVAVSPERPDETLSTKEKQELEFEVLSDRGNAVAERFGLRFEMPPELRRIYDQFGIDLAAANGDPSWTLPIPATYVIDRDGVVRYAFANADYTRRAEPADVVEALERLER